MGGGRLLGSPTTATFKSRTAKLPAAAYVGAIFDPEYWNGGPWNPITKKAIQGWSLGGRAKKLKGAPGAPTEHAVAKARHDVRDARTGRFASEADFDLVVGGWKIANPSSAHPALLAQAERVPKG